MLNNGTKLSCDAIGGRFIVGRDRLSFCTGGAIALAHGKAYDLPAMPACFVEFEDVYVEEVDLALAEQQAVQGGLDTKRWFEGIRWKRAYLLTLVSGQRFVSIWSIVDCWRSFLFVEPASSNRKKATS